MQLSIQDTPFLGRRSYSSVGDAVNGTNRASNKKNKKKTNYNYSIHEQYIKPFFRRLS